MEIDVDTRVGMLESSVSRMVDTGHETNRLVKMMNKTLVGYMDEDKNIYIDGIVQRFSEVEHAQVECLSGKKKSKRDVFRIIKEVLVAVGVLYLTVKLGIKQ